MADNQDYGGGEGGKRSAEDQRQNQNKRPRGDYNQVVFRLMIRSNNAGGVIGKGGENIKRLRSDYDAKVSIPDCNGPERIIKIVTKHLDNALDCISDIIPKVGEKVERRDRKQSQDQSPNQGQFFIRIMVHQSHAGAIIGRAGFKIKELREKTGAHFKVYTKTCPNSTDRVVQLTGTPDVIIKAAREVYEICSDTAIKGLAQEYDPFTHDTVNFDKYGGFLFDPAEESYGGDRGGYGGDRGGGGGGGQWNRGPPMARGYDRGMSGGNDNFGYGRSPYGGGGGGPMGGGGGGGRGRGGRGRGGGGGPGGARGYGREQQYGGAQGYDFGGDSGRGQSNFGGGGGGGGFDGGPSGGGGGEAVQTQQVTIPNDLAGSIIGRGGQRIKKIRTQSGAQIKIDDPLQGAKDRIITITGTQHDIAHAKFLLQNSVKEYQNSGGAVQ